MIRRANILSAIALSLLLLGPAFLAAQEGSDALTPDLSGISEEKVEAVRRFLEVSRTADLFLFGLQVGLDRQALESNPDVPDGFVDAFKARLETDATRFVEALIPLYDEHLSLETMNRMTEFYETPAGQEFLDAQQELTTEMMALGERWGMVVAAEVILDLAKEGG